MKTYGILCFVLALFMILTPLLSLDYSSFSLSNVKSTFQKENDSKDEEKLLDEKIRQRKNKISRKRQRGNRLNKGIHNRLRRRRNARNIQH